MKTIILLFSLIIGLGLAANAQLVKKSPEQRAAHITKALQKRLNLNQQQATQVNQVLLTQATRIDSLKSNPSTDKKSNHLAVKSIRLAAKTQIAAILNDEQKQKFAAWEKEKKERHKEKKSQKDTQQG